MISLRAMMQYRYVSGIRGLWATWFGRVRVAKRWAGRALAEFEVSSGRREEILSSLVADALCLATLADELARSEEHTSELQSRQYLVCRLLLEKKKKKSTA